MEIPSSGVIAPIVDEMSERFPATLELVVPASVLALLLGIYGGAMAAAHRKGPIDYVWRIYAVVIYSLPIFWLGLMLQLLFGVKLGWLPVSGRIDPIIGTTLVHRTNIYTIDAIISGNWAALASVLEHLILANCYAGLDPFRRICTSLPHQRDRNAVNGLYLSSTGAWNP